MLDLVYVYALLTVGHGAADDETIRALDKIRYRRRDVAASWALGDGIAAAAAAARAKSSRRR